MGNGDERSAVLERERRTVTVGFPGLGGMPSGETDD